jgi:hypothetical protein
MAGTIASFSSTAVAERELSLNQNTFEIVVHRSFFGAIVASLVLTTTQKRHHTTTDQRALPAIRNIFHFTRQNLWFYAVGLGFWNRFLRLNSPIRNALSCIVVQRKKFSLLPFA